MAHLLSRLQTVWRRRLNTPKLHKRQLRSVLARECRTSCPTAARSSSGVLPVGITACKRSWDFSPRLICPRAPVLGCIQLGLTFAASMEVLFGSPCLGVFGVGVGAQPKGHHLEVSPTTSSSHDVLLLLFFLFCDAPLLLLD